MIRSSEYTGDPPFSNAFGLSRPYTLTRRRGPNFPCCNTVRMFSGKLGVCKDWIYNAPNAITAVLKNRYCRMGVRIIETGSGISIGPGAVRGIGSGRGGVWGKNTTVSSARVGRHLNGK